MNFRRLEVTTAARNTVEWFTDHPIYLKWLKSQHSLLWVKGKPGAGKSTLMKFAVLEAQEEQKIDFFILLTFFFNSRGQDLQKTAIGLFRSILHQLLEQAPTLHAEFAEYCKSKGNALVNQNKDLDWHLHELRELFSSYVYLVTEKTKIRVLVDALDECGEEAASDVVLFLESLMIDVRGNKNLIICFSCRYYPILESTVGQVISVDRENAAPIALHVTKCLKAWHTEELAASVRNIEWWIIEHASGVFQWVCVVLGLITSMKKNGKSLRAIQKALVKLPKDLGNLYESILRTVMDELVEEDRARSTSLIQWVYFARKPLSLEELSTAMAFEKEPAHSSIKAWKDSDEFMESSEQMERTVIYLSGGLAGVFRHGPYLGYNYSANVEFIHESVKEFIDAKGFSILRRFFPNLTVGRCYDKMAKSCINYLKSEEIRRLKNSHQVEVRHYASNIFWYSSRAEEHGCSQSHLITLLEVSSTEFVECWELIDLSHEDSFLRIAEHKPLLHILAWSNIVSAIKEYLRGTKSKVDLLDDIGRTPLHYAIRNKHPTTALLLLENGAKLSYTCTLDPLPLSQLWMGDSDFTQPKAAVPKLHPRQLSCDALYLALEKCDIELAQFMLSRNRDIHLRPQNYGSLLQIASNLWFPAMVQLLLDRGDDVNSRTGFFGSALQASCCILRYEWSFPFTAEEKDASTVFVEVTKILSSQEVEVMTQEDHTRNEISVNLDKLDNVFYFPRDQALLWNMTCFEVVELLLNKGANVNYQGGYFGNALQAASHAGNIPVVRLLLCRGANVNAQGGKLGNALQAASSMGHSDLVKLLLDKGADVNAQGGHFGSALQAAAFCGSILQTLLLLDHGADIDAKGGKYGSALQAALENGHRTREHKGVALLLWSTQQATENPLHRPYLPEKYYRAYYNRE